MSLSLKLAFANDTRRISVPSDLTFQALLDKLTKMFPEFSFVNYAIKYRDEEGDVISINSDEELKEAIRLVESEDEDESPLLRLFVVKRQPQQVPQHPFQRRCGPCPRNNNGERFVHPFEQIFARVFDACKASDSTSSSNSNNNNATEEKKAENDKPIHFGVICDGCETTPLVGNRFKSTTKNDYDLCEGCFAKASADEQSTYVKIERPGCRGGFFRRCHPSFANGQQQGQCPRRCPVYAAKPVVEQQQSPAPSAPVVEQPKVEEPVAVEVKAVPVIPVLPEEPKEVKAVPVPVPVVQEQPPKPVESAPAPSPSAAPVSRFEQMLQTLNDMGFTNRQRNIETLVNSKGNLIAAIQSLLGASQIN